MQLITIQNESMDRLPYGDVKFVSPHLFLTNWVVILTVLLSSSVSFSNSVPLCFVVFCIFDNYIFLHFKVKFRELLFYILEEFL